MTIKSNKRTTKPSTKYQTYMLRTCNSDYTSYNDFRYPKNGFVYAPDWDSKRECGNGLHGLLRGEGDTDYLSTSSTTVWQVLMVDSREVVDIVGKVKVPRAWVILSGSRDEAVAKMLELGCYLCAYSKATAGDNGTATAGYEGTATAGFKGTANAGSYGTATAGDGGIAIVSHKGKAFTGKWGTATAGVFGTATVGYGGTATAGHDGTATADDWGTATAGNGGTATVGNWGAATAGDWGTATAGKWGTASAGKYGAATAGNDGTIQIKYWDTKSSRYRTAIGYIGEKGLLPNTKYRVYDKGKFYEVK